MEELYSGYTMSPSSALQTLSPSEAAARAAIFISEQMFLMRGWGGLRVDRNKETRE